MGKVGDDTRATVGLLGEDNSKVRSTRRTGSCNEDDGEFTYNQRKIMINWVAAHK